MITSMSSAHKQLTANMFLMQAILPLYEACNKVCLQLSRKQLNGVKMLEFCYWKLFWVNCVKLRQIIHQSTCVNDVKKAPKTCHLSSKYWLVPELIRGKPTKSLHRGLNATECFVWTDIQCIGELRVSRSTEATFSILCYVNTYVCSSYFQIGSLTFMVDLRKKVPLRSSRSIIMC